MERVHIQHFSDVLCVWAYIAQVRVDELITTFGDQVELEYRFIDVFGDCPGALTERWKDRGGMAAYGAHVQSVVARFDHVEVHEDVWCKNPPNSSMSCQVFLRAVGLLDDADALPRTAWAIRTAFFGECIDVSSRLTQLSIAEQLGLDRAAIEKHIASGRAHAAYSSDLRAAKKHHADMSPTLLFNQGRQQLAGNVGYRVIEANIKQLLSNPAEEASWC